MGAHTGGAGRRAVRRHPRVAHSVRAQASHRLLLPQPCHTTVSCRTDERGSRQFELTVSIVREENLLTAHLTLHRQSDITRPSSRVHIARCSHICPLHAADCRRAREGGRLPRVHQFAAAGQQEAQAPSSCAQPCRRRRCGSLVPSCRSIRAASRVCSHTLHSAVGGVGAQGRCLGRSWRRRGGRAQPLRHAVSTSAQLAYANAPLSQRTEDGRERRFHALVRVVRLASV